MWNANMFVGYILLYGSVVVLEYSYISLDRSDFTLQTVQNSGPRRLLIQTFIDNCQEPLVGRLFEYTISG